MNLNMKIHPAIAIAVVVLGILATGLKVWADGKAKQFGGPAQLLRDPAGQVYLQIQSFLLEHDPDGSFVRRHDLSALGADLVIGAVGFFSNGDILLRRGPDQRSLGDNIDAYQRKENTRPVVSRDASVGLARCSLSTLECASFATPSIDLLSTFSVFIDWSTDNVYISDTSRHLLRKYSPDGLELAAPAAGFRFPNQLMFDGSLLLVADTNKHRIAVIEAGDSSFGKLVKSINVVPEEAASRGDRWPSHFAKVGDEWWVNNMQSDMRNGGIYAFDSDWNYKRRIALPDAADPISILPFGSGALISDWDNNRVYVIDATGAALPDVVSKGLDTVLQASASARRHYLALSWLGFLLLGGAMLVLFVRASVATRPQ